MTLPKRIVITGASTGIGHATARALAKHGHALVLVARRADLLLEVARECLDLGAAAATVAPIDLSEPSFGGRLADHLRDLPGGERVLINNAGVAQFGEFHTTEWSIHAQQIEVNLLGLMAATHALLPGMLVDGSGLIVNVLSIAAAQVFPGAEAYSASKAGALAFGRSLAASYRRHGIRVTQILPGATDTPIWGEGGPDRNQMLSPDAVARVIRDVVEASADRVLDEITVTPPLGVL